MTTTPDSDVRAALDGATHVDGLSFDPEAVLLEGHRVVRRRRIAVTGLVAAATAVVAVVAVQLGTGQPRALPAGGPSSSATGVASPLDESALLYADGASESQVPSGAGVRLRLQAAAGGRVTETWTFLDGSKPVRSVRREVARPKVGGTSLLLPAESGLRGSLIGWIETGSSRTLNVAPVFAPGTSRSGSGSTTRLAPADGGTARTRYLFMSDLKPQDTSRLAGFTWSELLDDADPAKLGRRAALSPNPRTDIDRAVLTAPDGSQWLTWADDHTFGLQAMGVAVPGPDGPPPLQVFPMPGHSGIETTPDRVFGWADGEGPVTATSSDATDRLAVSTQRAGGRTAFLISPSSQQVKGVLTISGGGTSTTVDLGRARQP